jgi:small subunit ribosomal protein S16
VGSKKNPIWRVVVADQRSPRDGRFIEAIGHYNPQTDPSTIVIDRDRLDHWLGRGAQPTGTVKSLIKAHSSAPPAGQETAVAQEPAAGEDTPAEDAAPAPAGDTPAEEPAGEAPPAEESAG